MKRRLKEPFGKVGLTVAIVALVMALVGGAYAAGGLTKPQEKQVKKIAKKYAGKDGAPGAAGANGTNGTNGAPGANGQDGAAGSPGTPGTPGADGKTVLNGTATPNSGVGTIGDFYIETDISKIYGPKAASGSNGGWGTGTDLRGTEGSPWTAGGTLPSGKTETGTWATLGPLYGGPEKLILPISFPIPLAAPIPAANIHFMNEVDPAPAGCTGGTAENPKADPGHLCIYTGFELSAIGPNEERVELAVTSVKVEDESSTSGAFLSSESAAVGEMATMRGSFAVTAPTTP